MYNIDLAINQSDDTQRVQNDLEMGSGQRIFVQIVPDSGGKTTFLQAVGLVQILGQVGRYVQAQSARISLCDNICTHYPRLEDPKLYHGRIGEEAVRLRKIFDDGGEDSIFIFNETLSSTSMAEAPFLAQNLLEVLCSIGARAIYATRLHQLAAEESTVRHAIVSMVAGITTRDSGRPKPSFAIEPGPPLGKNYANELASQHGITKSQLLSAAAS